MNVLRIVAPALVLLLLSLSTAAAQQTGSVSGLVLDAGGQPVTGAEVRVEGDLLPAGRTMTTASDGLYQFQVLQPGTYTVEAATPAGQTRRTVVVEVDKDTQVDLLIGVDVKEDVLVLGAAPVVDLKSTEVNFNYSRAEIEALPLERTYKGLFQLIPGVAETVSTGAVTAGQAGLGGLPSAGGSRQDNTFLVDGVNITNPGFGYLSTDVNELDLAEFNVKRGAITAEFGRAAGVVTNVVTRSGTNDFRGAARFELQPSGWSSDSVDPNVQENVDRYVPAVAAGGPLVQDRLFWYASGRFQRGAITNRVNLLGAVPDLEQDIDEYHGKITAQPNGRLALTGSYRYRPYERLFAGVGIRDSPQTALNGEGENHIANVSVNWFPAARTVVEVKYLHSVEDGRSVAVRDLGFRPPWQPDNLTDMGSLDTGQVVLGAAGTRQERIRYPRDEVRASLTQFLDFGGASHQVKAGFGIDDTLEELTRKSNGWGFLAFVGPNNSQVRARYYPDQPTQKSRGRTFSLFLQDDITIAARLTVNAGILFTRDVFRQEAPLEVDILDFGFGDEIQPRLGINYNVRKDVGDKVYVNYGRYYLLDQKSSARSLAPGRLFTADAIFDRVTGVLLSDLPGSNTVSKTIDPAIDPTYNDEWLVGYATPLQGTWAIEAFYVYRDATNFIEDLPRNLPASSFWYTNLEAAERTYRSFTVELARRLANRWSLTTSYSWSRLEGNIDFDQPGGETTRQGAIFNTSSIIQDGPGTFVEDIGRNGPLSQDRTHVFKVFGTYRATERLTVSSYVRTQSGTPWSEKGRDWYNGYNRYLEPAGSRRNDTWTNVDLLASYGWGFGNNRRVEFSAVLLNLFDTQTALFRDQRSFLDGRIRYASSALPAGCGPACATAFMEQGRSEPNARFGQPTEYALPRRVVLTAQLNF